MFKFIFIRKTDTSPNTTQNKIKRNSVQQIIGLNLKENSLKTMALTCRAICRYRLILVQTRLMRTWYESTISMLENSLTLYYFSLEQPWPGFSPITAQNKIITMRNHLLQSTRKIECLIRLTNNGCTYCLQL